MNAFPNSAKLFMSSRLPNNLPSTRQNKFNTLSCKANRKSVETSKTINFYKVLSIDSNNAGVDEIKKAYRNMALRYHPDVCDPSKKEKCTQAFIDLHKAYKTLLDQTMEKEYTWEQGLRDERGRERFPREKWESQITELRRRSCYRQGQMEGTWACRMRAQSRYN